MKHIASQETTLLQHAIKTSLFEDEQINIAQTSYIVNHYNLAKQDDNQAFGLAGTVFTLTFAILATTIALDESQPMLLIPGAIFALATIFGAVFFAQAVFTKKATIREIRDLGASKNTLRWLEWMPGLTVKDGFAPNTEMWDSVREQITTLHPNQDLCHRVRSYFDTIYEQQVKEFFGESITIFKSDKTRDNLCLLVDYLARYDTLTSDERATFHELIDLKLTLQSQTA